MFVRSAAKSTNQTTQTVSIVRCYAVKWQQGIITLPGAMTIKGI